jgi:hypothetical protein
VGTEVTLTWADEEHRGSLAAVLNVDYPLVGGLVEYNFGDSEVVLVAWAIVALPFVVERLITGSSSGES